MTVSGLLVLLGLAVAPNVVTVVGGTLLLFLGIPLLGFPVAEVGASLIVAASLVLVRTSWRLPPVLPYLVALIMIWFIFTGLLDLSSPQALRRLGGLLVWIALMLVLALPGPTRTWTARGLFIGLVLSVPGSYLLTTSTYGIRWTGFATDPNAFAMTVALSVPIISYSLKSRSWSVAVWLLGAVSVVMSDSRTGMLALTTGAAVYLLLPIIRAWALAIPAAVIALAAALPDDIIRGGRWEDRLGSDLLRERIQAAANRQIQDNFLTGRGLGTGSVDLSVYGDPPQQKVFFLHNSYTSLLTEIGIVGVGLYGLLVIGAVLVAVRNPKAIGALAALSAGAVMATQLGEVLLALPMAVALGFAWANYQRAGAPESRVPSAIESESLVSRAGPIGGHR